MPKHRPGYITPPPPAPDGEGQRPCARGPWCASSSVVFDNPDGTGRHVPALGTRAFCERDRLLVGRHLRELPAQWFHLRAELGKPAARGRAVRVPFGPRMPIRVDVDALMALVAESVVSWHERVAALGAGLIFPAGQLSRMRRDAYAVVKAADTLSGHLDDFGFLDAMLALEREPMRRACDLRDLDALADSAEGIVHAAFAELDVDLDGGDAGMEVLNLRYLCRSMLGETKAKPEELVGVPCRADGCGWRAVYRAELPSDPDAPVWWTECARCGDRMSEETYREWTRLCAAYERNKVRVPATLENLPGVA